jgi:hypothetical protein
MEDRRANQPIVRLLRLRDRACYSEPVCEQAGANRDEVIRPLHKVAAHVISISLRYPLRWNTFQFFNQLPLGMPQIIRLLHVEPKIGAVTAKLA